MDMQRLLIKIRKLIPWISIVGLAIALLLFERVNYITTYESLAAAFGKGDWVVVLSLAVVITDIAALARIFTPQTGRDEPRIVKVLLGIWFAVSFFDMFLSWYFAMLRMESTQVQAPTVLSDVAIYIMPVIVAVLIWGIQFGLLYTFGMLLDRAIHGRVRGLVSVTQPA